MLLHTSGGSLIASFALGLYLVLAPTAHATAITVCVISSGAFIFGNMEFWHMFKGLCTTACARLGIRRLLATWWDQAPAAICLFALLPFTSLIVIFGLPPITANLNKTLSSLHAKKDKLAGQSLLYVLAAVIIWFSLSVVMLPPYIRLIVQRWKYYKTSGGLLALLGEM